MTSLKFLKIDSHPGEWATAQLKIGVMLESQITLIKQLCMDTTVLSMRLLKTRISNSPLSYNHPIFPEFGVVPVFA